MNRINAIEKFDLLEPSKYASVDKCEEADSEDTKKDKKLIFTALLNFNLSFEKCKENRDL